MSLSSRLLSSLPPQSVRLLDENRLKPLLTLCVHINHCQDKSNNIRLWLYLPKVCVCVHLPVLHVQKEESGRLEICTDITLTLFVVHSWRLCHSIKKSQLGKTANRQYNMSNICDTVSWGISMRCYNTQLLAYMQTQKQQL